MACIGRYVQPNRTSSNRNIMATMGLGFRVFGLSDALTAGGSMKHSHKALPGSLITINSPGQDLGMIYPSSKPGVCASGVGRSAFPRPNGSWGPYDERGCAFRRNWHDNVSSSRTSTGEAAAHDWRLGCNGVAEIEYLVRNESEALDWKGDTGGRSHRRAVMPCRPFASLLHVSSPPLESRVASSSAPWPCFLAL